MTACNHDPDCYPCERESCRPERVLDVFVPGPVIGYTFGLGTIFVFRGPDVPKWHADI